MTRFEPALTLARLVVFKGGRRAYDQTFHSGVNIIRGENSTGKSTIADLIFFALGGDLTTWKDEAASCDTVFAELILNGARITTKRDIIKKGQQPLWIYFGPLDQAYASSADGWQRYPYRRYGDRESFTQVIFRLLNLPEVPAEAESNITMHQILRLMYVDQMTPVDRIFRLESNDSPLRRQAVGDLLCGLFDDRIYPAQLLLRQKEKEFEVAERQLSGLYEILNAVDETLTLGLVDERIQNIESQRQAILIEIENLRKTRFSVNISDKKITSVIDDIKSSLDKVNGDIAEHQTEISQLNFSIEDSRELITEISRSLQQLRHGQRTSEILGPGSFHFCPSCLSPLQDTHSIYTCALCKSHIEPDVDRSRYARMRNELELQLKESKQLQEKRLMRLDLFRNRLKRITKVRDELAAEYLALTRNFLTEADAKIEILTKQVGFFDRELIELAREQKLAEQLSRLSRRKTELNREISELKEDIRIWKEARDRRQMDAYRLIQRETANILSEDVPSEAEFSLESEVYFDFSEDRVTINGKSGFSASSLTIIRNSFHLALLIASCIDSNFRYPRFVLMDNIEDKGMTQARSWNFQKLIVDISRGLEVEHQIIFTTSMMNPALDLPEFTVGDRYSFSNKSLRV